MVETGFIPPHGVRAFWPYARPRLEAMRERFGEEWIAEDVYSACVTGKATIHDIRDDGEICGFFVLEPTQEFGTPSLHVWVMHHEGKSEDAYQTVIGVLAEYAKRMGAERIRFSTRRAGWARRLAKFGFMPTVQYLEKRL